MVENNVTNYEEIINNKQFIIVSEKLNIIYESFVNDTVNYITEKFGLNRKKAQLITRNIAEESMKFNFKLKYSEKDRIIQFTSGGYYIKITASKIDYIENNIRKLREWGLSFEDGIVCKLYLPNQKEPVLVLKGRKRNIGGREFWMFSVGKYNYEIYKNQKFIIVIESSDERVQNLAKRVNNLRRITARIVKKNIVFIWAFFELKKKEGLMVNSVEEEGVTTSQNTIQEILVESDKIREEIESKYNNTKTQQKTTSYPASAPQVNKVEQVREVIVNKVEQVEHEEEEKPHTEHKDKQKQEGKEKKEQIDKKYYEKLRRELDEFIDWLTVKRLKEEFGIEHIKSFEEFKKAVENDELINGAEKLIKDIPMTRTHVRKFIEFLEENNYKIDNESIFKFFNSLEKKMFTKDTLSRYKSHLKQFINYLGDYENYIFISNIKTNGRKGNKGQGFFYTPEEMEAFLKQVVEHPKLSEKEKDELVGLLSLMYVTGLRYSEVMRLQVKDFDFENRIGIVRRVKAKKGYARPIFITEAVRDYLIALIKKYNKKPDDLLFDRSIRFFKQPHKVRITEKLKKIGIELNVSGLRDSYATLKEHYRYNVEVIHDLESLTAGHSAKIRDRHYNQIKTRFEEIFDNRELYFEEYEFVKWLRNADDVIIRHALKNVKIPPVQLTP